MEIINSPIKYVVGIGDRYHGWKYWAGFDYSITPDIFDAEWTSDIEKARNTAKDLVENGWEDICVIAVSMVQTSIEEIK